MNSKPTSPFPIPARPPAAGNTPALCAVELVNQAGKSEEDVVCIKGSNPSFWPRLASREGGYIYYLTGGQAVMGRRRLWSETVGFEFQLCLLAVCF